MARRALARNVPEVDARERLISGHSMTIRAIRRRMCLCQQEPGAGVGSRVEDGGAEALDFVARDAIVAREDAVVELLTMGSCVTRRAVGGNPRTLVAGSGLEVMTGGTVGLVVGRRELESTGSVQPRGDFGVVVLEPRCLERVTGLAARPRIDRPVGGNGGDEGLGMGGLVADLASSCNQASASAEGLHRVCAVRDVAARAPLDLVHATQGEGARVFEAIEVLEGLTLTVARLAGREHESFVWIVVTGSASLRLS